MTDLSEEEVIERMGCVIEIYIDALKKISSGDCLMFNSQDSVKSLQYTARKALLEVRDCEEGWMTAEGFSKRDEKRKK